MIGIDFGTSNTVVSALGPSGPGLVPLDPASSSIPTLLYLDQRHRAQVGHEARRAYGEAVRSAGSGAVAPAFRLFQALKLALKDPGIQATNVFGTQTRIEKIVSLYLTEVRRKLESIGPNFGGHAVVGRPVELGRNPAEDRQMQNRFEEAFLMAGFEKVSFVYEPVAAAVDLVGQFVGRALIFDFGGGTLDISLADIRDDRIDIAVSVGTELGGYHLDEDIARHRIQGHFGHRGRLVTLEGKVLEVPHEVTGQVIRFKVLPFEEIRRIKRLLPELIPEAVEKDKLRGLLGFLEKNLTYDLYRVIDEAKIVLSDALVSEIGFSVPPHVAFLETLTRPDFETLIAPRVAEAEALVLRALGQAGWAPCDVDQVIRVGGSSQVPAFSLMLDRIFPGRLSTGNLFHGISLGLIPAHERGLGVSSTSP